MYKLRKEKTYTYIKILKREVLLKKEAQLSFGHNDIGTFSLFSNQNSFKFINYMSEFSNSPPHAAQQFSVKSSGY